MYGQTGQLAPRPLCRGREAQRQVEALPKCYAPFIGHRLLSDPAHPETQRMDIEESSSPSRTFAEHSE